MTQESHKSNIVLIIIAIIGVMGTIIGATITVNGNYNVEKLRQETELTRIALVAIATQGGATQMVLLNTVNAPTQQPAPTQPPAPTYTPYPTLTVEPTAISTIIPTIDTRPTDTPPGTVLQIGQTWRTKGFSIQLKNLTFAFGDEADLEFTLTNNTGHTLFFHFSNDTHVTMKDDLGHIYNWATPYEYDIILENGSSEYLRLYKGGNFSGIQYLITTVDLPGLIYAQWKN
jgi:hypothetical protein